MVNIKDVAEAAGVSIATVSHVINKNYYVSDELIKKVKKAINELNYSPNLLAGSLRRKRTGTIGLIVPDNSNLNLAILAKYIEDVAYSNSYNIIICNSSYDVEKEFKNLEMLISKRVDGILMLPETTEKSIIQKARDSKTPMVIIERKIADIAVDTILIDHFEAGYKATKYLINLGHRNIVLIDRRSDKYHSIERRRGYMKALEDDKIEFNNNFIIRGDLSCASGFDIVQTILKWKTKITAVECYGDFEAMGAMSAAIKSGLKIPEDLSIIGYDELPLSEYIIPELTTIRSNIAKVAEEAVKTLMLRIKRPDVKKVIYKIIEPELIIRKSTSTVPKN